MMPCAGPRLNGWRLECSIQTGSPAWIRAGSPPRSRRRRGRHRRTRKLLERLGRLRLLTAFTAGVVLGIGVPKRLLLAALTATTISTAGVRSSGEALLVVVYVAIATAIVWVPVMLFILFGNRAIADRTSARFHKGADSGWRCPAVESGFPRLGRPFGESGDSCAGSLGQRATVNHDLHPAIACVPVGG
jgi:hypothetical protein